VPTTKSTLFVVNKVAVLSLHCMYGGMAKDTSWAEVTSNSEKIRPVALAIVELCKSEGIKQAGRQLVSQ